MSRKSRRKSKGKKKSRYNKNKISTPATTSTPTPESNPEQKPISPWDQINNALKNNELSEAETLTRKLIEKENTFRAHYALGYIIRLQSSYEKNRLNEALQCQETAIRLMEDDTKSGRPYYEIAKIYQSYYFENRDDQKAIDYFKKSINCDLIPYDAYLQLSSLYQRGDQANEKINTLREGIANFPKEKECYLRCATQYSIFEQDNFAAEKILISALENEIHSSALYNQIGDIKFKQGDYKQAIHYYERILPIDCSPKSIAIIYNKIAKSYLKLQEYDSAEKYFFESSDQYNDDKKDSDSIKNANKYGLICCYYKTGRVKQSIELLGKFTFNNQDKEDVIFCGFGIYGFGCDDYGLDDGMEMYDFDDIISDAVSCFDEISDELNEEQRHAYYLSKALLLSEKEGKFEESLDYLKRSFETNDTEVARKCLITLFELICIGEDGDWVKGKDLTKYINTYIEICKEFPNLTPVLGEHIRDDVIDQAFKEKRYARIIEICDLSNNENLGDSAFEAAYSYSEKEHYDIAKRFRTLDFLIAHLMRNKSSMVSHYKKL